MNIIAYGKSEFEIFEFLITNPPFRIITDGFKMVFDYQSFYILALPSDHDAASQNKYDEAINASFTRYSSRYQEGNSDKTLYVNKSIAKIWLVRTILYFTDNELLTSEEEATAGLPQPKADFDRKLHKIFGGAINGHSEIVCRPDSEELKHVNPNYSNLVDAGIVLEVDGKFLACYADSNGYLLKTSFLDEEVVISNSLRNYQLHEFHPNH